MESEGSGPAVAHGLRLNPQELSVVFGREDVSPGCVSIAFSTAFSSFALKAGRGHGILVAEGGHRIRPRGAVLAFASYLL